MNLRAIDLNLLVILDALLDEAHVSRAAARIGLSQPATSSALDRCRHLFEDPLLERAEGGMRLTAKANALREPLRRALAEVETVLGVAEPTLAETRAEVRVVMADLLGAIIVAPLYRKILEAAPGIHLVLHPWGGGQSAMVAAARGTIDLIVSVLPRFDSRQFHVEDVLDESYVVAMRADHPAAGNFDLDGWLSWPHVVVTAGGEMNTALDALLASMGRERRIGAALPSFMLVPDMLRDTDLIALVPSLCGRLCDRAGLVLRDPPIEVPGFTLRLAWHRRSEADVAVRYVAAAVGAIIRELAPVHLVNQ
jgi:DNA-binding transcriptional LysR family regulator